MSTIYLLMCYTVYLVLITFVLREEWNKNVVFPALCIHYLLVLIIIGVYLIFIKEDLAFHIHYVHNLATHSLGNRTPATDGGGFV